MRRFGASSFASMTAKAGVGAIHIYDVIGRGGFFGDTGVSAQAVADALGEVAGCSELHVYLNSPGGSAFEGVAIYNQLRRFPARKTIFVDALCASIATVISCAGDRVVSAKNAQWMIHLPRTFAGGTAEEMRKAAEQLDQTAGLMADTYVDKTKQKRDDLLAWMKDETWFTAEEAVAKGFADEVAEPAERRATAHAGHPIFAMFAKAPDHLRTAAVAAPTAPPIAAQESTAMLKFLIAALGLAESATEADVQAAITKRLDSARAAGEQLLAMVGLTGKTSVDEAKGIIQGWKASAEQVPGLTAKVTELEKKAQGDKLEQLIAKGKADGKLAPAMEAWAKTQSVEALTAYLEVAPKLAPTAKVEERPPGAAPAMTGTAAEIAAQCGVTSEALAAFRENPNPTAPASKK